MSRPDRLFVIGAAAALALALIFGWFLQPEQPKLAGDGGYQEQSASYRAGGSSCEPAKIRALAPALRQAKADACAEGQEQHREAANNFIENRRAAIAAEASAAYTATQARIEAWGAAIGLLTLVAAVAAAFFAKRAAEHTEAGAEAAHDANRPWLEVEAKAGEVWIGENTFDCDVSLTIVNRGKSPAINVFPLTTVILFPTGTRKTFDKSSPQDALLAMFNKTKRAEKSYGSAIFPGRDEAHEKMPSRVTEAEYRKLQRVGDMPVLPYVAVGVRYRYGKRIFFTIRAYSVKLPPEYRSLKVKMGLPASQVQLIPHHTTYVT
jgi:hypothetical protein